MCAENEYFDYFRVNTLEVSVVLILFFWVIKNGTCFVY